MNKNRKYFDHEHCYESLHYYFKYNDDGSFTRIRVSRDWDNCNVLGKLYSSDREKEDRGRIYFDEYCLSIHQASFLYHHGYLPEMIDHKDRDKYNHRVENLRECSNALNQINTHVKIDGTKIRGVDKLKSGKFRARMSWGGVRNVIGTFDTLEKAARARLAEELSVDYLKWAGESTARTWLNKNSRIKIYICSGFFNEDQNKKLSTMLTACKELKLDIYSPRDDFLYIPGKTDPQEVFEENLKQIKQSDMLLVSTAGKDMGALWECGYAYALNIPLVFYYPDKGVFNLMLSQSARAVLTTNKKLYEYLSTIKDTNLVHTVKYTGELE